MSNESQILLYRADDGKMQIQVKLQDETVWLTQAKMAELFQKDVRTINEHIQIFFEENALERKVTIRKFRIIQIVVLTRLAPSAMFVSFCFAAQRAVWLRPQSGANTSRSAGAYLKHAFTASAMFSGDSM